MAGNVAGVEAAIAGARQISAATFPEVLLVNSKEQWDRLTKHGLFKTRRLIDESLVNLPLPKTISGYCSGCSSFQDFVFGAWHSVPGADGALHLALSETGVCPVCRISSRMRFALDVAAHRIRSGVVYMTEQTTSLFACARRLNPNVIGSEYLGPSVQSGAQVNGVRHEDLMALSLPSDSVDLVVCLDVLEHVPDPARALEEIARVLAPGGMAIVTFPFFADHETSVRRATISETGEISHILEPVYHGNPLGGGALVFNDIGWDLVDETRRRGVSTHMINYWSPYRAHFGRQRFACLVTK